MGRFAGYVIIDMLIITGANVTDYQFLILYAVMAAIYVLDAICYFLVRLC